MSDAREDAGSQSAGRDGNVGDETDAAKESDAPLGGSQTTEDELEADNEVEEDTLRTLNPDDPA